MGFRIWVVVLCVVHCHKFDGVESMGLIQKAESYGSKYKGHHLRSGGKFKERKLGEHKLKETHLAKGKLLRDGELDADDY